MNVVTIAISTIMVKSADEMTPMSSPIFKTTSSISPRVFINIQTAPASRQGMPLRRAPKVAPPNLPATATTMMSPQ